MVRGWAGELETRELCEKPFCSKHAFLSLVGKQFWHLAWFGMGWTGGYGWRWDEPAGRSWDRPLSVVEWLIGFAVWKWLFSGETGEVDCLLNFWTVYLLSQMFEEKLVSKKKSCTVGFWTLLEKKKGHVFDYMMLTESSRWVFLLGDLTRITSFTIVGRWVQLRSVWSMLK